MYIVNDDIWLVQSGSMRSLSSAEKKKLDSNEVIPKIYSMQDVEELNPLVSLNNMACAEFEFDGQLRSLYRIIGNYDEYSVFDTSLVKKNDKRKHLFLLCKPNRKDGIINAMRKIMDDDSTLKSYPNFNNDTFNTVIKVQSTNRFTNFWWCIDNSCDKHYPYVNGDWMAFLVNTRDKNIFMKIFEYTAKEMRSSPLFDSNLEQAIINNFI